MKASRHDKYNGYIKFQILNQNKLCIEICHMHRDLILNIAPQIGMVFKTSFT